MATTTNEKRWYVVRAVSGQESKIKDYIKDSFEELKSNVSWTERSELQRLVVIVLVFSVLFSLAIWGADTVLSRVIKFYFKLIG